MKMFFARMSIKVIRKIQLIETDFDFFTNKFKIENKMPKLKDKLFAINVSNYYSYWKWFDVLIGGFRIISLDCLELLLRKLSKQAVIRKYSNSWLKE